jgi:hypothetical protein
MTPFGDFGLGILVICANAITPRLVTLMTVFADNDHRPASLWTFASLQL